MKQVLVAAMVDAGSSSVIGCSRVPALSEEVCRAASEANVVCTTQGAVRGVVEGDMVAFKGIPYAAPPIGALRWQAPLAPASWTGVRDGSQFGPMCPQMQGGRVVDGPEEGVDHTQEIRYLFTRLNYEEAESDREVSRQTDGTGRPSPDDATWPAVRPQDVRYLELGPERFPNGSADATCGFWDSVTLPSPHL